MKSFKEHITNKIKREVWRDSKGTIVYIKGIPPRISGGMSRWEFNEGKDMKSGSIVRTNKDGSKTTFIPPFTKSYE